MKKGEKLLFLAGILLAIGALAFSAWKLRGIYGEYQEGEDTYEELASFVEEPEDKPEPDGGEPDAEPDGYLKIDFEGLQAVNPDVIAWIDIPGLSISYPVVQGTDNAYYLHHLFTGEYNSSGSIFADWHNQPDFTDPEHHCIRPQYEKRQYVWNPLPLSGSGSVGSISLLLPVCAGEGAEISDLLLLCRVCGERGLYLCVSGRGRLSELF